MPLGAGALAGVNFDTDRQMVAAELGFDGVAVNSIDAVADRDVALELLSAHAICATHLSRIGSELVIWSSQEFGFVTMSDGWSSGSSIMPQKKNPDAAELLRAKAPRVVAHLTGLHGVMHALPLTYNKDMQEDKEPAFDAIDTLAHSLRAMAGMVDSMHINTDRMAAGARGGFMAATDLADHLVGAGVPFREAHEIVGRLVLACERDGITLQDLTAEQFATHAEQFGPDVLSAVDIEAVVARRVTAGGTGHEAVSVQLLQVRDALEADHAWLESLAE